VEGTGQVPPLNDEGRPQGQLAIVKPRVLSLLVFSGLAGFVLATTQVDATWEMLAWLMAGGVLATASANIFNNILDKDRDSLMERTMWRPLPAGRMSTGQAAVLGVVMGGFGLAVLYIQLNPLTATLTLVGMLFYIIVYTIVLKPVTYENITIGGVAGAFPPIVGWTSVTGQLDWPPLILGLIVILWTPPHFWSLALFHKEDYERASVPMLPVVKGEVETHRRIAVYTGAMVVASSLFMLWDEMSALYLIGVILLNVPMVVLAIQLVRTGSLVVARRLFRYSNLYLLLVFVLMILDAAVFQIEV
jgi:protoheme IX farnesyltransferase